ncbi:hypothetical protein P5V15_007382 [Pogonomyrmex californicus]
MNAERENLGYKKDVTGIIFVVPCVLGRASRERSSLVHRSHREVRHVCSWGVVFGWLRNNNIFAAPSASREDIPPGGRRRRERRGNWLPRNRGSEDAEEEKTGDARHGQNEISGCLTECGSDVKRDIGLPAGQNLERRGALSLALVARTRAGDNGKAMFAAEIRDRAIYNAATQKIAAREDRAGIRGRICGERGSAVLS